MKERIKEAMTLGSVALGIYMIYATMMIYYKRENNKPRSFQVTIDGNVIYCRKITRESRKLNDCIDFNMNRYESIYVNSATTIYNLTEE